MKKSWLIGIGIAILIAGAWYWFAMPRTVVISDTGDISQVLTQTVLKTASDTSLGTYLTDAQGVTLYSYTKDGQNVSNCSDQCAANWPPYVLAGIQGLSAAEGIPGPIGLYVRADGSPQVTYQGKPLYYYKDDAKPGEAKGQNVNQAWFVVNP